MSVKGCLNLESLIRERNDTRELASENQDSSKSSHLVEHPVMPFIQPEATEI